MENEIIERINNTEKFINHIHKFINKKKGKNERGK